MKVTEQDAKNSSLKQMTQLIAREDINNFLNQKQAQTYFNITMCY